MTWFRSRWPLVLAAAAIPAGVFYWWLSRTAVEPAEAAPVFYPAVMLYNYTAATCATTIGLLALLAVVVVIPQVLRCLPRSAANLVAAALALAAALLVCAANVPQWFVQYRHIDRVEQNGRVYQLGVRVAADGDNYLVLCDCEPPGWACRCRHLTEAGLVTDLAARPELLVAGPGRLEVRIGTTTVWSGTP